MKKVACWRFGFDVCTKIEFTLANEPRILLKQMVAEDPVSELERFRAAVSGMQTALDDLLAASDIAAGGEHRDVLESYRMFAADRGWLGRIAEAIRGGLTAEVTGSA